VKTIQVFKIFLREWYDGVEVREHFYLSLSLSLFHTHINTINQVQSPEFRTEFRFHNRAWDAAIGVDALHAMLHRRLKPLVAHMPTAFRPLMHRILYNCRQDEDGLVTYKNCVQAVHDATTGPDVVRPVCEEEPLDEVLSSIGLEDDDKKKSRVVVVAPYAYDEVEKEKEEEKKDSSVPPLPIPTTTAPVLPKSTTTTEEKEEEKEEEEEDRKVSDRSPTASEKWARNTVEDLRDRVYRKYGQLQRAFVDYDSDRNARISNGELRCALERLNLGHNVGPEQINALLEYCGVSNKSKITFDEFAKALIEPPVMRNSDRTERSEYERQYKPPVGRYEWPDILPGKNEPKPRPESRRHFNPQARKPTPRPDERKHFRHIAKQNGESDVPSCLPGADHKYPSEHEKIFGAHGERYLNFLRKGGEDSYGSRIVRPRFPMHHPTDAYDTENRERFRDPTRKYRGGW